LSIEFCHDELPKDFQVWKEMGKLTSVSTTTNPKHIPKFVDLEDTESGLQSLNIPVPNDVRPVKHLKLIIRNGHGPFVAVYKVISSGEVT
jgi:hypothetical protein